MTTSTDSHDQPITLESDPYAWFAYMRKTEPVWRGTIMDTSMSPPELLPDEEWTLFDFNSVFARVPRRRAVRLGAVQQHDRPGLRADDSGHARQAAPRPPQPGAKAFRQSALERWEPAVIDPICDHLVDEIKDDGAADLVKAVTFEFPTRVTAALLGLPQEDLELFRRLSLDLISIMTTSRRG